MEQLYSKAHARSVLGGLVILSGLAIAMSAALSAALDFEEVKKRTTSPEFRKYVENALKELKKNKSRISQLTLKSILDGRVKIDELSDLTKRDFLMVLSDFEYRGIRTSLEPEDYEEIQNKNSKAYKELARELEGTMWSNRIYVADAQTPKKLASTLVHEVNHVLNRSDEGYFEEDRTSAFVHEYRAFYVEAMFNGQNVKAADFPKRLKRKVLNLYQFESVDLKSVPDVPPGELLPTDTAWKKAHL